LRANTLLLLLLLMMMMMIVNTTKRYNTTCPIMINQFVATTTSNANHTVKV
jgi:hypothetical protein